VPGAAVVGAPGCVGGGAPGAFAVGAKGLPPGDVPAPAGGAGGPPWAPGTGSVLVCGSLVGGAAGGVPVGATLAGVPGGIPGLAVGWTVALSGIGALPCWISAARCVAACGNIGATGLARSAIAGLRLPGPVPPPAPTGGAGGRLITVLMTVVLWMLLKTMLFGGGAT
jgi:hypothetical protein